MRRFLLLAMVLVLASGCSEELVQTDLTGIELTVGYHRSLDLDQLRIQGILDRQLVFGPGLVPDGPRSLDPTRESVVILVSDLLAGNAIHLRVDGLSGGRVAASARDQVDLIARVLVKKEITLQDPAVCGDGIVQDHVEECDDNNQAAGDGCNPLCYREDQWSCDGEPSQCWHCGDGNCDADEDLCRCPEDCPDATCGDGLCCLVAGENSCTCPQDCTPGTCGDRLCCQPDGENTCSCSLDCGMEICGNRVCCPEQDETAANCQEDCATGCGDEACLGTENACSCPEDCGAGSCGDGICCEPDGEDRCSCPEDCGGVSACGDGLCCNQTGENGCNCEVDCGPGSCKDGVCCQPDGENACNCPEDCGESICGDDLCCASDGEDQISCPDDCQIVCGDGRCLFGEDVCNCPEDCDAARCGDGNCCAAGSENPCSCPADCGNGSCGDGTCCASDGEDRCTCPTDCGSGFCGDKRCCQPAGEDACTCPQDCGSGFCGDQLCCPGDNENTCTCEEDCGAGSCGDSVCCPAQDEDRCNCPGDCGEGSCGDGLCCTEAGENTCNCEADCGQEFCGNGRCCLPSREDPCTCPADCGAGVCGDGICCQETGEDPASCPDDCAAVCPDGVCSPSENPCSCPQDCGAATCGDGICCPADEDSCSCPDDCGAGICGDDLCCQADLENSCTCPGDCGEGSCGDGICCAQTQEDTCSCTADCGTHCGDGCCNGDEAFDTCPDDCTECGNGRIETGESCDDGGVEPGDGCDASCAVEDGWTCAGEPSCCQMCGNQIAECTEACDGTDLRGATCLSLGYLPRNGPTCRDDCNSYLVVGNRCDAPINSEAAIVQAIDIAHGQDGHEVIAIHAGIYTLPNTLVLDECGGSCTGGKPFGITLRPAGGLVAIDASGLDAPVFGIVTGNNTIRNLRIDNARCAVSIIDDPQAGGNTLSHLMIRNADRPPEDQIRIRTGANQVVANALSNGSGNAGVHAVWADGGGNTLAMNVVLGEYQRAFRIGFAGTGPVRLDHNSIRLGSAFASTGVAIQDTASLCYRNNIVYGNGTNTTGLALNNVTLGDPVDCDGVISGNNLNLNSQAGCSGSGCASLCAGGGPMCDLADEPMFAGPELCLDPASGLIDGGTDLGYDMSDFQTGDFHGTGPEVGARESGVQRVFGNYASSCP